MTRTLIETDRLLVKSEDSLVSDMDGEKVMLSVRTGKYYNLGQVGGRIWELLGKPSTLAEITQILTEEYDVDRDVCEQQVRSFLQQLYQEGLIREAVSDSIAAAHKE